MSTNGNSRPLSPYRVLDLTNEKGFMCAKILGDLGADVIKVEPPGGDPSRKTPPYYHDDPNPEKSLYWWAYNSNKRGVTLNIESADGRELFKRLVAAADFLIESFHPGYLDGLGLGYPALSAIRPNLVMTSITPFGQNGPYKDYKDSDLVLVSLGGLVYITGEETRPPTAVAVPQSYISAGAQAATGAMIAHFQRITSGEGQHVDVSMHEAVVNTLLTVQLSWDMARVNEGRGDRISRGPVRFQSVWPCKDGYVCWVYWVAPGWGEKNYPMVRWMEEEGMGGRVSGVMFEALSSAEMNQDDVKPWEEDFGAFIKTKTKRELYQQALERGIFLLPVNDSRDILADDQLAYRKFWQKLDHPELGEAITYPGAYYKSTGGQWSLRRRAPLIGEHNDEVYLGELGLCRQETVSLAAAGVL